MLPAAEVGEVQVGATIVAVIAAIASFSANLISLYRDRDKLKHEVRLVRLEADNERQAAEIARLKEELAKRGGRK